MQGVASSSSSSGPRLEGIDDVEDFPWANEGESSMSWDRFSHLYDLMQMGNTAFRENRLDEAINCYSKANNIKPNDPIILSNRCASYLRFSQFLKNRSSSDSEFRPLSGLDPTTHAGLALKDAEKVVALRSNSLTSHILKANALILRNFPEEYAERKAENDSLINLGVDLLPLFVMDVVLPCQKFHLNIFEPRYRLMVRRIMEGNHRMGMVIIDSATGSIAEYGCEVEITEYRVAEVEWVQDIYPAEGTIEMNEEVINRSAAYAREWLRRAREAAQGDRMRLVELHKAEGLMPSTRDPERFSFWLATVANPSPSERLALLRIRDTKERISRALIFMRAEAQGCRVQ
nr:LON peptidase N-terminal domain and RING finger protein 1-like [Ipomoea batatas]GMC74210.1 LON peptidase N-terminal domain and RING finger protein 1-like [Ipomoea batatas]